jgi:hypothetical protein
MLVITNTNRFEMLTETLTDIETQTKETLYNLLSQYEQEYETLITNQTK